MEPAAIRCFCSFLISAMRCSVAGDTCRRCWRSWRVGFEAEKQGVIVEPVQTMEEVEGRCEAACAGGGGDRRDG